MRHSAIVAALALAGCGGVLGIGREDHSQEIHVGRYVGVNGEAPPDTHLGFTYGPMQDSGFHCLINPVLLVDDDPLRMRNVVIHELGSALILDHGTPPYDPSWFTFDGDTKGDAAMVPEEAAWFAQFGPYDVEIEDVWVSDATRDAIDFIHEAAGTVVFK